MHKKPGVDPRIFSHMAHAVHEEWLAFVALLRFHWPLVLLFVLGSAILIYVLKPLPPRHLRLAAGQPNSSLEALGKKYAENFARNGVTLELVTTAGAFENADLLKQGKADAAFAIGGMLEAKDWPGIVSLGSVEYIPFWMFYRGADYDGSNPAAFFRRKKLSINLPGSTTRDLATRILALHGITLDGNPQIVSLSSSDSVDALLAGKIDGVFLVAGIESQSVQRLIAAREVKAFSFASAEAYAKYLRFLEPISVPRGSFNLVDDNPPRQLQIVATTTTILATEKLHPALQHLFLSTAKKLDHEHQNYFRRAGGFPANIARNMPTSRVAEHYYNNGAPTMEGYLPFWLSSFIDQVWVFLLGMFAVGYPLVKLFPNYRSMYAKLCMTDCFDELRNVDHALMETKTLEQLKKSLDEFDRVEHRINHLWIPAGARDDFYNLKNAVEIVRMKTERIKKELVSLPVHEW